MTLEGRYPGAWHAAVDYLGHLGIDTVFGLPGDDLRLLDALAPTPIRMVLCRDQRNAVFMATGHALQSGRPAVCAVGRGPALTNALTGLLEARASGVPLVLLAGGTAAPRLGSGAFQELDQMALAAPLARWAHRVEAAERVVPALERAFLAAAGGVPGPVYLELPDHLLDVEVERRRSWSGLPEWAGPPAGEPRCLASLLEARRPLLVVGGGMRHRNPDGRVERLATRLGAGMFVTASGRGAVDEDHPLFCGLSGLYAAAETAELWPAADLVVALGSRLEETATTGWGQLAPDVPVLQVNPDPLSISTDHPGPRLLGDGGLVVASWLRALDEEPPAATAAWVERVRGCRAAAWDRAAADLRLMGGGSDRVHVAEVLAALDRLAPGDRVLVQENGLQDMWSYCYPYWRCGARAGSVAPSEQTSLGFGAAAAAGVALAAPGRTVVALAGDGAFEVFRSDLATVACEGIPVLYVVLRNGGYGWLQHQLDRHHELAAARYRFAGAGPPHPSHPPPAGVHHAELGRKEDLEAVLRDALRACAAGRPAVVEVPVHLDDVPPGVANLEGDHAAGAPPAAGVGAGDGHDR